MRALANGLSGAGSDWGAGTGAVPVPPEPRAAHRTASWSTWGKLDQCVSEWSNWSGRSAGGRPPPFRWWTRWRAPCGGRAGRAAGGRSALPAERRLADGLGVSRGTVVAALTRLRDTGWVRTGTAVPAPCSCRPARPSGSRPRRPTQRRLDRPAPGRPRRPAGRLPRRHRACRPAGRARPGAGRPLRRRAARTPGGDRRALHPRGGSPPGPSRSW
ncbi:GntR family transcriptional regulator [Streptomyces lusitanus]|uniref:GntR family transcriptional regulator n=1 Tax=Streptomyces lusitanus TaxID=68232 RepID=UPI003639895A